MESIRTMKKFNYYQLMEKVNKGLNLDDVEVEINSRWVSWKRANGILKGVDFQQVMYRSEKPKVCPDCGASELYSTSPSTIYKCGSNNNQRKCK
jgi:hypothetical protein